MRVASFMVERFPCGAKVVATMEDRTRVTIGYASEVDRAAEVVTALQFALGHLRAAEKILQAEEWITSAD